MVVRSWTMVGALASAVGCGFPDVPATGGTASTGDGESSLGPVGADSTAGPSPDPEGTSAGTTDPGPSSTTEASTGEPLLGPPYPIVLAHGFFGFDELAGLPQVPYWYGVPEHLAEHGETSVCVGEVDPFNDSTDRGLQLLEQAIACAEATGHAKVNIIGHSQGGLDARVVASLAPDLVASVTTIATPHHGTPVADIVVNAVPGDGAAAIVDWLTQTLGAPLWDEIGNETSLFEAMAQMSTAGIAQFNATYPDVPGVLYTSVTGRTGLHSGGTACEPGSPPPPLFITQWDDTLDTTDPLFLIPEGILSAGIFSQEPNDGLVRVVDARWGEFLGCIPADHVDEVGHLLGDAAGLGNPWDHLEFYSALIAYLRERGV